MRVKTREYLAAVGVAAACVCAQSETVITVRPERELGRVSPMLYGQFIEHLGTCIDGGLYEPGSALSDADGFRRDVLEKARELRPRILRWPGGTYTKIYHWQDGVGPQAERRRRPNLIWGGEESNRFGTAEFVAYCRALGAEPYISVNMGTGTPEEAANWVEYCNGTGTTYYAELRRKHGSPAPYGVRFWGLGNEEEAEPDCGRLQDPKEYARVAWQFAKLMKLQDPSIRLIVAGVGNSTNWNQTVLGSLHPVADYLSAHWYFRTHDYARLLGSVAAFDRQLGEYERFLATFPAEPQGFSHWYRFPPRQGPVRLAIDEWGLWNGGAGGREALWNLHQTYTWQDALAVASWLNAMHRRAGVIGFATWAQMVNIIAPIQSDRRGSVRQTVFHPLALYARECGDVSVEAACESPALLEGSALPALDVAATRRSADGALALAVVNRHPMQDVPARVEIVGGTCALAVGWELSADSLLATNALAYLSDECVRSRRLSALSAGRNHLFPARSITLLVFKVGRAPASAVSAASLPSYRSCAEMAAAPAVSNRAEAITSGPQAHWFGYYDKDQLDSSGRYLLSLRTTFEHRLPKSGEAAEVGMVDLQHGSRWIALGESRAWCWQQGCMLQWRPGAANEVVWNDREGNRFVCRVMDVRTRVVRTLPRAIGHLSPDGRTAICEDFSRAWNFRPGYGYPGVPDPCANEAAPAASGVWRMDMSTGETRLLLTLADLVRVPYPKQAPGDKHYVNHLAWSPDGRRFLLFDRWSGAEGMPTRVFTLGADGEDLRLLSSQGASHYVWRDPEHALIWADGSYRLYRDNGSGEPLAALWQAPNGHQSYIPGTRNEWLVTDTYDRSLYLVHLPTGSFVPLGRYPQDKAYAGEWRCDLHPRVSRDGRWIFFDSPHAGNGRQLYRVDISFIVGH